jgi:branched-chain amino acid transport system substrate-binding protein
MIKKQWLALAILIVASMTVSMGSLCQPDSGLPEPPVARAAAPQEVVNASGPLATELTCSEPVQVGVVTTLSGPYVELGIAMQRSFRLGMEYGTGAPGQDDVYMLDGCEVQVLWEDDYSTPEGAAVAAHKLIGGDGADILVGSAFSSGTEVIQAVAAEYGIVHIAPSSPSNDITGANFTPTTFRTSHSSYQDAANLCEYLASQYDTLVQIADDDSWNRDVAQAHRDACTFFGSEFVADDIFVPYGDYEPYLQQVLDSGANAWVASVFGIEEMLRVAVDMGLMDEMDLALTFYAFNESIPNWYANAIGTTGGIPYHYTSPANAINVWLVEEMQDRHGVPPDLLDADNMTAALLILEALQATAGDVSADALIAATEGMEFEGPKGTITIRPEDHLAIQDQYIVRLLNVDDPDFAFFEQVATYRPVAPCLLPEELQDRCGSLPIGTLKPKGRIHLPLVLYDTP